MKTNNSTTSKRGTPEPPTTLCLVKQAQAGDRGAFGTLYERYSRYVKSISLRIVRDEGEAEEVCHDVFIQAIEKLEQLKNPACFGGWIGAIAYRKSLNYRVKRRPIPLSDSPILDPAERNSLMPADAVIQRERVDLMRVGLDQLKPLDRNTLVAFYLDGQTLVEMSEDFEAPVGTIKRRLHVARKRLAKTLDSSVAV
jgi:RNA polymerase sigma-70 factor (ECF subfamily)